MIYNHGKISINVIKDNDFACLPFDWAIVNTPPEEEEADKLLESLSRAPNKKGVILLTTRHKRKDRPLSIKNTARALNKGWEYLETVNIWYEKPSSCSSNGFLPVSESCHVYYKGPSPDVKRTGWFSEEYSNATNLWNVAPQKEEGGDHTHYQKFSWEINMLMLSMSNPLESGRFLYLAPISPQEMKNLNEFCNKFGISVSIYIDNEKEATNLMRALKS